MNRAHTQFIACLILAGVFAAAAVPKIADPHAFALAIHRHQFAPSWTINLMAIYLPWLELVAALALFVRPLRATAARLLAVLLLAFTALLLADMWRGLDIACGCFTLKPGSDRLGWMNIFRNVFLLALTVCAGLRLPAPPPRAA